MKSKQFINEAFTLLEDDDIDFVEGEIEIEPVEDSEEINDEIEGTSEEEEEPTLDNLEDRIERLEDVVYNDAPPMSEEEIEELSEGEKFRNKVKSDFMRFSKYPEDTEITEELLEKKDCRKSYIPQTAVRNHLSNEDVRNIILGR